MHWGSIAWTVNPVENFIGFYRYWWWGLFELFLWMKIIVPKRNKWQNHSFKIGFLILSTIACWTKSIFVVRGCSMSCKIFGSIPRLHPGGARGTHPPPDMPIIAYRHCLLCLQEDKICFHLWTAGLKKAHVYFPSSKSVLPHLSLSPWEHPLSVIIWKKTAISEERNCLIWTPSQEERPYDNSPGQ